MKFKLLLVYLVSSVFLVTMAPSVAMAGGMYDVLKQQPYTVLLDANTKIDDIGRLCSAQKCYKIGFYTWRTKTHCAKRLLVFEIDHDKLTYLGGYRVTQQPVAIVGTKIMFAFSKEVGNQIDFDTAGPPQTVWLDGENSVFFK